VKTLEEKNGKLTLLFKVKDTGIGIREEDISKLF
jgi:signal transduction histidine kinase